MNRTARPPGALTTGLSILAAVAAALLVLPLIGLLVRTPWSRLPDLIGDPQLLAALLLSLWTSLASLGLSVAVGVPLAWALARRSFPGRRLLRALCVLPMVLPPVVGGVALLSAFGRRGLLGGVLEVAGVSLPFSTAGVVVAQAFVAMPFLIVTVEAGLRAMDRRYEDVAMTLGAPPGATFRRVTMPIIGPSLGAGMALCWARALGEFGATITFAGNLQGRTQTMPLAVYVLLEGDPPAAILLSLLLLVICVAVLVALREHYLGAP